MAYWSTIPSVLLVYLWSTGLHYKPAYNGFSVVYVFYISGGLVYWSALLTGVHLVAHIRSAATQLECLAPPVKGGTQGLGDNSAGMRLGTQPHLKLLREPVDLSI